MKKHYFLLMLFCAGMAYSYAQSVAPYTRVYTTLNTKCQNSTCHSGTASDGSEALRFDGTSDAVYSAIYNITSSNASSVEKNEKLIKPQHPYYSFLLRKIAGIAFDTDLAIEANEGDLMLDINGQALSNKEIEFIRQWVMYGAKKTYTNSEGKPDWQVVSDYYDNPSSFPFLPKPAKPVPGTGVQLRMGPIFIAPSGDVEQEWLQVQEVNFPYPAAIHKIDGYMNQQSHHFLLFKFDDSLSAYQEVNNNRNKNMALVGLGVNTTTSFDGQKILTSAWQDDQEMVLPTGTAIFWDKKTYLDMNYHIKNYSPTSILPCDFYFNVYYTPRNPNIIEMKSNLVNNATLFLTQGVITRDYDDPANRGARHMRYLWNITSHAHKYGTDFDFYIRDTTGVITDKIYEGFEDYANFDPQGNPINLGYYAWDHPSTRYWPNLLPVHFGKHNGNNAGVVGRTTWDVQQPFVTFGFTTEDEMQLWYYMYTDQDPFAVTAINDDKGEKISLQVMPNPMNNNGRLVYTLEENAKVSSSIVDMTGKLIAQLTEENQDAGLHQIEIGSEKLSSGIYFARLNVNGLVYTKKFIVTE